MGRREWGEGELFEAQGRTWGESLRPLGGQVRVAAHQAAQLPLQPHHHVCQRAVEALRLVQLQRAAFRAEQARERALVRYLPSERPSGSALWAWHVGMPAPPEAAWLLSTGTCGPRALPPCWASPECRPGSAQR